MSVNKPVLLDVKNLKVHFSIAAKSAWPWTKPSTLKAVDGVNVRLYEGETLGVVGSLAVVSPPLRARSSVWCNRRKAKWCGWGKI